MNRLHQFPQYYPGLAINNCGILFLSTPHSGTTIADWNSYLVELASHGGLRSKQFTQWLSSFNNESRNSKERFAAIQPPVRFECLCETRKTIVAGVAKLVSFGTDYSSILCVF